MTPSSLQRIINHMDKVLATHSRYFSFAKGKKELTIRNQFQVKILKKFFRNNGYITMSIYIAKDY